MKKKVCASLIAKNTFIYWTRLKTENLLATAKQLIRKNCLMFEKSGNFFHSEITDKLDTPLDQ